MNPSKRQFWIAHESGKCALLIERHEYEQEDGFPAQEDKIIGGFETRSRGIPSFQGRPDDLVLGGVDSNSEQSIGWVSRDEKKLDLIMRHDSNDAKIDVENYLIDRKQLEKRLTFKPDSHAKAS
ncbi:hypothetical protein [Runella zeae]|uniref:hypothetical protein n=1 Tax=Runella zeae TaxID=94255 RepID=UPI002355A834|nr:hypothetical protein [Runella zeae]